MMLLYAHLLTLKPSPDTLPTAGRVLRSVDALLLKMELSARRLEAARDHGT